MRYCPLSSVIALQHSHLTHQPIMSAPRTKRASLVSSKPKPSASLSTDVAAAVPHFKPPTTTPTGHTQPLVQLPSTSLTDEASKMQQRLHSLRATMEEDKRQRDERIKQRKAAQSSRLHHSTADDEQPAPLTQKEYLKQLQARLEAKKAATRDKVRQVKAAMDKASEYVAPLGQGQRLALFERVSEEWLKDDDGGMQTDVGEKARVAAVDDGVSSVVVEESKEAVLDGDVDDGSVVIGAAEEQDAQDMEAAGHAEFAKAREEWLQSLQQPTAAATFHSPSRPSTASSSTTTSAVSSTATVRLSSLTSSTSSASLLAGSHFDESASAASFQEARQAWLQSLTAKLRTTTTPNATSPTLAPQTSPSITERVSCYQCYRLFAMGAGKAGGESGRELCGVECVEALERVERLRRERARSMRAMEQRILALQHEQQQLAAQQQQQTTEETEAEDEVEDNEERTQASAVITADGPAVVPVLALPIVAAGVDVVTLELPVSARRFTVTEEQPEPVVEFPSA